MVSSLRVDSRVAHACRGGVMCASDANRPQMPPADAPPLDENHVILGAFLHGMASSQTCRTPVPRRLHARPVYTSRAFFHGMASSQCLSNRFTTAASCSSCLHVSIRHQVGSIFGWYQILVDMQVLWFSR